MGPMFKAVLLPRKGFNAQVGLPKINASWQGVTADPQALKQYHQVLNLEQNQNLPLLYPHVLAGSMHMHMLTHKHFPIGLLGAVHLKNSIKQVRPIQSNEEMSIQCELGQWRITDKGLEFDFSTQVVIQSHLVWSETSTYFKRGRFTESPSSESSKSKSAEGSQISPTPVELDTIKDVKPLTHWLIPKNRGKAYAKISGDYNPIHISKILAKLFGLKRDIAHGFGILAQAIACEGIKHMSESQNPIILDTVFKGPLFLEEEAHVKTPSTNVTQSKREQAFDIYCAENPKPSICTLIRLLD